MNEKFNDRVVGDPKYGTDETYDFLADLEAGACNILQENPGIGFEDWQEMLLAQYPAEVVDALGSDPDIIEASLADLWSSITSLAEA